MGDVMYSVVAIFNNTILHIWKLLKESILKDLITRKKPFVTMYGDWQWWLKESYRAQNSLELKLPSRSSPPFYAKQRTLSPEEKKNGH